MNCCQLAEVTTRQFIKMRAVLKTISDEGWYTHSNNAAQLVEILDEHKRASDEALGITESNDEAVK